MTSITTDNPPTWTFTADRERIITLIRQPSDYTSDTARERYDGTRATIMRPVIESEVGVNS